MQFTIEEARKSTKLKDIAVSVPKSIYASKIINNTNPFENFHIQDGTCEVQLNQMLTQQHPLILSWLIFSLVAIGFLFPLLFVIH